MKKSDLEITIDNLQGDEQFNRFARDMLADDNIPALQFAAISLAARARNWRRGKVRHGREVSPTDRGLSDEMRSVGEVAGIAFANEWKAGDFYHDCGKAIGNAMDEWLRAGNGQHNNTWRGAYNSDTRTFSSQAPQWISDLLAKGQPLTKKQLGQVERTIEGFQTHQDGVYETEEPEYIDVDGQRDKVFDRVTNSELSDARIEQDSHVEVTSHDGGHADDERLNPNADPDRGYGVDGAASRGVPPRHIAQLWACRLLYVEQQAEWALLASIEKEGGEDRYITNGRRNIEATIRRRAGIARAQIRTWRDEILATVPPHELQAKYTQILVPDVQQPRGPKPVPAIAQTGLIQIGYGTRPEAPRSKGRVWRPWRPWGSLSTFHTISGRDHPEMQRNVKRWHRLFDKYLATRPAAIADLYRTLQRWLHRKD